MKIVSLLQNQWFKNPAKAQAILDKHPDSREWLIAAWLFMGCLTGKRLKAAFGDLRHEIVWEEASRHVGGKSDAAFPADPAHMQAVVDKHQPQIVLTFGRIAKDGLESVDIGSAVHFAGPHPAARHKGVVAELNEVAKQVKQLVEEYNAIRSGAEASGQRDGNDDRLAAESERQDEDSP